ncbi:DUF1045 domain-containing protein [Vannielia litorea]|uniref:DUF1045 domain-containing protein n=1 Tax=Vannielia litorea TaxID=1217970 RepID=UPI001BCDDE4A|nr:DUF1045 domain-containing protein [Vannielia litorea]
MSEFSRYAIYYAPPEGPLADFGAAWLGWDALAARTVMQPPAPGLDMGAITEAPQKYGFHGTIKPPFRLKEGRRPEELAAALAGLCADAKPPEIQGLKLSRIGGFLALVPVGEGTSLTALAGRVVEEIDGFRAPPGRDELARRRGTGLSPRQDALLLRWGYPYVMEEFRFHVTLTGKLTASQAEATEEVLKERLVGLLPAPFIVGSLCLFGERARDGRFQLVRRVPLGGGPEG